MSGLDLCTPAKLTVLVSLCLQNTAYTLLRKYSLQIEHVDTQFLLGVAEFIKLVFSVIMTTFFAEAQASGGATGKGETALNKLLQLVFRSSRMAVLAAIYAAMNILSFVALRRIDAVTFTVCAQLKILTTGLCSSIFLGRRLSPTKWRALILLVLASILVTAPQVNASSADNGASLASQLLGICAVLLEVTLSGAASVYFEKVVKGNLEGMSLWDRNFQLAMWSILLYTLYGLVEVMAFEGHVGATAISDAAAATDPACRSLFCWSMLTWAVALLSAGGGLLVALSIKVADSVLKTVAIAFAIVLSTLCSHWFLGGPLDLPIAVGALCSILGIFNYAFDATVGPTLVMSKLAEAQPLLSTK
eukprot:COSAG01_NODE_6615_length_3576_cov_9.088007_2_plen_361_part_00